MTPNAAALQLLTKHGMAAVWQRATAAVVDAHLAGNVRWRDHRRGVQQQLSKIASSPGPDEVDVYRAAKLMIDHHGKRDAMHVARQRAYEDIQAWTGTTRSESLEWQGRNP